MAKNFRIALVASPKSGSDWLSGVLAPTSYSEMLTFHAWNESVMAGLRPNTVMNLHSLPERDVLERLRQHDFQPLTVARHPFDVLIALLFSANCDFESYSYWMDGLGAVEKALLNVTPRHPMFIRYAVSPRAQKLLSITPAWWEQDNVIRLRFEDLAADPLAELQPLMETYAPFLQVRPEEILERQKNRRFGQPTVGEPPAITIATAGLWRHLLPAKQANWLATLLRSTLGDLGYQCDPDPELSAEKADQNWFCLLANETLHPLRRSLELYRTQAAAVGGEVAPLINELHQRVDELVDLLVSAPRQSCFPVSEIVERKQEITQLRQAVEPKRSGWRRLLDGLYTGKA